MYLVRIPAVGDNYLFWYINHELILWSVDSPGGPSASIKWLPLIDYGNTLVVERGLGSNPCTNRWPRYAISIQGADPKILHGL